VLNLFVTFTAMLAFSLLGLAFANNGENRRLASRATLFCAIGSIVMLGLWRPQDLPFAGGLAMFALAWYLAEDAEYSLVALCFGAVCMASWTLFYEMSFNQQLVGICLAVFIGGAQESIMRMYRSSREKDNLVPLYFY